MSETKPHPHQPTPQYRIGDLVWCTEGGKKKAQLRWPAMVAYDPKLAIYFRTPRGVEAPPSSYHVQYFGVQAVRGWVTTGNMEELKGVVPKAALLEGVVQGKQRDYEVALEEAEQALAMTRKERKLGFIFNYDPPNAKHHKKSSRRSTSFLSHKKRRRLSNQTAPSSKATPRTTPPDQATPSDPPTGATPLGCPVVLTSSAERMEVSSQSRKKKSRTSDHRGVATTPTCSWGVNKDACMTGHGSFQSGLTAGDDGGGGKGEGSCLTPLPSTGADSNQCTPLFPHRKSARIGMKRPRGSDTPTGEEAGLDAHISGPEFRERGVYSDGTGPSDALATGPRDAPSGTGDIGPLTNGDGSKENHSIPSECGSKESCATTIGTEEDDPLHPARVEAPPLMVDPSHPDQVRHGEDLSLPLESTAVPLKQADCSSSANNQSAFDALPTIYLTPSSSSTDEDLPKKRDHNGSFVPFQSPTRPSTKKPAPPMGKCSFKDGTCSICGEEGEELLLCEGPCGTTFHLDCIGLIRPPGFNFVCDECLCIRRECFLCKGGEEEGEGEGEGGLHKCARPSCDKIYHLLCAEGDKLFTAGKKPGSFTCPLHACARCKSVGVGVVREGEGLLQCVQCPLALHRDQCLVAGCEMVGQDQMLCYRHVRVDRDRNLYSHINIGTCLECGEPGSLYCCDFCSAAYHDGCLDKELRPSSEGDTWCCPNCVLHDLPAYGSMVICKHGRHRWWPGEVVQPDEVPDNLSLKKPGPCMFVVKFYGTHNYCWTYHGRVLPYTTEGGAIGEGMVDKRGLCASDFIKACAEALVAYPTKRSVAMVTDSSTKSGDKAYIRIKANKYLVPRPDIDFPSIPCQCTREHPCDDDFQCVNRALLTECDPESCPVGELCKNQRMLRCEYPETEVVHTGARGWGLKVLRDLKEGDFVIEYVGEILNMEMCQERLREAHEGNRSNFYMFTLDHGLVIDARDKSNPARFINHSCDPNCYTQKWIVSGETRIGIFARQNIPAGTELTFDYQFDSLGNEKKQCHCGSAGCSGFLGLKKKEPPKLKAPKMAKKPKPKSKRRSNRGGMCTDEEAKLYEDECFVCRDGGTLVLCDEKGCSKVYHPSCIGRRKPPASGWLCPHHFCDICYARSTVLCPTCPVSFCEEHGEGKFVEVEGRMVCRENCAVTTEGAESGAESKQDEVESGAESRPDGVESGAESRPDGVESGMESRPELEAVSRPDGAESGPEDVESKLESGQEGEATSLVAVRSKEQGGMVYPTEGGDQCHGNAMSGDLRNQQWDAGMPLFGAGAHQNGLFLKNGVPHQFPAVSLQLPGQVEGYAHSQLPLMPHPLLQYPLYHTHLPYQLDHTLMQQSFDHTHLQQPFDHTLMPPPFGHTHLQQPFTQPAFAYSFQTPFDYAHSQRPAALFPSMPPCPPAGALCHMQPCVKPSQQPAVSAPEDVAIADHPYVALNCSSVSLPAPPSLGVPSNCPIDSMPEDAQKKLVLSI